MLDNVREMCKIALENELYTDKDSIFYMLLTTERKQILEVAMHGKVAIALVWEYPERFNISGQHIGVYVKEEYRRMGYGSQLIEVMGGIKDRCWLIGEEGSGEFWLCLN